MWVRVWALRRPWIDKKTDLDQVTLLCESMDERVMLRLTVLQSGAWRDRVALRQLDSQIAELMGSLGLNPTDRKAVTASITGAEGGATDDSQLAQPSAAGITLADFRDRARLRRASAVDSTPPAADA